MRNGRTLKEPYLHFCSLFSWPRLMAWMAVAAVAACNSALCISDRMTMLWLGSKWHKFTSAVVVDTFLV